MSAPLLREIGECPGAEREDEHEYEYDYEYEQEEEQEQEQEQEKRGEGEGDGMPRLPPLGISTPRPADSVRRMGDSA